MKFSGTIETLKYIVASIDPYGEWIDMRRQHQFRGSTGGILNWWPSTGTINFQGPATAAADLEDSLVQLIELTAQNAQKPALRPARPAQVVDATYEVIEPVGASKRDLPALFKPSQAGLPTKSRH